MQIIDNKGALLKVRDPDRITTVIPKSRTLTKLPKGGAEVLVHYGLEEMTVLNNLGIKGVTSPIVHRYDWPGLYTPMEHQIDTASFLTLHRRAFCFNEQGTSKTASCIWAADYLMTLGLVKRVLVTCPLSIMESAWLSDLFKTVMHRKVLIAHNSNSQRRREMFNDSTAEFVIINHDGVEVIKREIAAANFDLIIADECNAYKTHTTTRWKILNGLLRPDIRLWMLTGTPAAQSPVDAYGLARLVNPSSVPKYFGSFRDQVMYKVTNFRWVPKPNAQDIVHQVLQPAIRYTKEECLDLPEMTYVMRDVPLSKQQMKYYEQLRKTFVMNASGEQVSAVNAAANLNKMLQISTGCIYTDTGEVLEFDYGTRYNVLKEVIAESSHKVLIFVPFRHAITALEEKLTSDGYKVAVIHGDVNIRKRSDIFSRFETKDDIEILIIQPQAASHGVTLVAASTVVYWGPVLSVETYLQCNARVHRKGQKNKTTVVHLQGSSVERKVYSMLRSNLLEHEKLVDLYKEILE